jgi:cobalt-zinc-cadmium efflux system protein
MEHDHSHAADERRLFLAMILTGSFMIAELIGGLISNSLALLADAGHMLTDTSALFLAWLAARISRRPPDKLRSYGYHRLQILAAFSNGLAFIVIVVWIFVEAIQRMLNPAPVWGGTMLAIAVVGLLVNVLAFYILHQGSESNLNLKGALVHVLGDLLGSVAAIVAAVVIIFTGWMPIDPLLSLVVAAIILRSAWFVIKRSAHILMEGTPEDVDVKEIRSTLQSEIEQVLDVHHVHVWSLTPERPMLTAHVTVSDPLNYDDTLSQIKKIMHDKFDIEHSTIQIEINHCSDHH